MFHLGAVHLGACLFLIINFLFVTYHIDFILLGTKPFLIAQQRMIMPNVMTLEKEKGQNCSDNSQRYVQNELFVIGIHTNIMLAFYQNVIYVIKY